MKKKDFKTRMVKILDYDLTIAFRGQAKVILKEHEAIEITEEEFNRLKTRKDPFREYNTSKKQYDTFVIPDAYGKDEHLIYVLLKVCKNYHGFKRHCSNCNNSNILCDCMLWLCYCGECMSHYIKIYKCNEDDFKFGITSYRNEYDDSFDDRVNYYMYLQLDEQKTASENEFIPVKWE